MSDKQTYKPAQRSDNDLTEAEIAARFESTVRRMANTKPAKPKQAQPAKPKKKVPS